MTGPKHRGASHPKLIASSLILAFSSGGSAILSFLLSVLIGRATGHDGLGIYAAALAWVFPLNLITEFGLGTLITREVARAPEQAHAYLAATTKARLLIGGSLTLALWLFAPLLSDNTLLVEGIRVSAPMVIILPFFSSFTAIFRAHQRMQPIALLNIGMLIAQVSCTGVVFMSGGGVLLALIVNTLTSAGQLVAAWGIYHRKFYVSVAGEGLETLPYSIHTLFKRARPFAIAAILAAIQIRLNILLIERFSGAGETGYYAAAAKFIEAGRLLPMAFFDALFPLLSSLATDSLKLTQTFRRVTLGLALYGVVFGTGITLLAGGVMPGLYGTVFTPAVLVLQLAGWSLLPLLLKQGRTLYWYARGHEQFVNRVTLTAIMLQGILGWWLLPAAGAVGAAVVSIVVESAAMVLLWLPFARKEPGERIIPASR